MQCPYCKIDNDRVIDSRASQDGLATRRRRVCHNCGRRFTTYETIEDPTLKVIKKDGARVPYDRQKIRRGIGRACWKRPISDRQIDATVEKLENELFASFETEVESAASASSSSSTCISWTMSRSSASRVSIASLTA